MSIRLGRLLPLLLCFWSFAQEKQTVTIGFLIDGPSNRFEVESKAQIEKELLALLDRDFDVRFPKEKVLVSNWEAAKIASNLDTLLADDEVDIVLCIGVLGALEACTRKGFPKPVAAPFGISSDLPIYPQKDGASGIENLHYLVTPGRVERDIELMKRMKDLKRVHVVTFAVIPQTVPGLANWVEKLFNDQDLEVTFVQVDQKVEEALSQLGNDVEMAYITPLLRFDDEEIRVLYDGLKKKRIPSVSLFGVEEVRLGALAGEAPESDQIRLFRRLALNIQRILLGEEPGSLPILMQSESKLTFNMETARAIDWYPDWDLQISADLFNQEIKEITRKLTLSDAVLEALRVNLDYKAATFDVDTAKENLKEAKSNFKPQADASVTGLRVDEDTAESSFGAQPETLVRGTLTAEQLLFSDRARAGVEIQNHALTISEKTLEIDRLNLALETSDRFLNYLKAVTATRVRRENLRLTRKHLDRARVRQEIGISGSSDVYRWESSLANDQQEAIRAGNNEQAALNALNQILNFTQETPLNAEAPSLLDPNYITGRGRLQPYVRNARMFEIFRGFMVAEGLRNAPELARMDALIAAKQREILTGKRSYYLPEIGLRGELNHDFSRSGAGSDGGLNIPGVDFPERKDTGWNVALNFSLPLYSGGTRKIGISRNKIELEQLKTQRRSVAQQIELNVRISMQRVASSSTGLDLSQDAVTAARKNLELVEDAYTKGVVNAIDLLDAQNAALVSELSAANAVFDFLIDLMNFQRAVANFDFFTSNAERDTFFKRLEDFYKNIK